MSKRRSAKTVTSVKSKKLNDENSWQEALESIAINDDHWWCVVTMMIETKCNHARFVSMFNEAADEGKRKSIYTLNRQKMLANVWSLSRQDPDKCPVLQRVCHHANKLFEANIESAWLLARVIKYMIYQAKVDVRMKKEQELKRAIEDEYRIMQTVTNPSTSKSIPKKSATEQSLRGKANTRLRKRDEEWRDIVYVDDAPFDGPNLYVILSGFHDPDLPIELMNIGVPLTCILKIKRPGEKLERVTLHYLEGKIQDTLYDRMRLRFTKTYTVDKVDLYKFWSALKNILKNPQTVQVFSNVAFLTIKPPILSETSDDLEYETLKKDIYDKVSFIVYDLYDLLRKHSNYLRSMLIQRYDIDEMKEIDAKVYRAILDALPTECVTVPILLHALLIQVEDNLDVLTDRSLNEQNVSAKENIYEKKTIEEDVEDVEEEEKVSIESIDDKEDSWVNKRLKLLNQKYKITTNKNVNEENLNDLTIQLILHGDKLSLNTYHIILNDDIKKMLKLSNDMTLADAFLQIYHDPRIIDCWLNHEKLTDKKMKDYNCYINNLINYFDPSVEICRENIYHYLHFLIFDKMIYGNSLDKKSTNEKDQMLSVISCLHSPTAFLNCPGLFGLTDKREILLPSYLEKNVYEKRRRRMHRLKEPLEEYNDVELLPKKVLLQTTYECFRDFEHFEKRYFEPTDSILLYFSNDYVIGEVSEKLFVSNLRTPVCLRDFVKYVNKEEIDWINREEEKYRLESIERIGKSSIDTITFSKDYNQFSLYFGDEHFILPNSLKARDLSKKLQTVSKRNDTTRQDTSGRKTKDLEKKIPKGNREKQKGGKTLSEKISSGKGKKEETNGIDTSFLPKRKILSLEFAKEDEPYEFVGYDLGNLRVQIVEKRKIFYSEDGTFVRVNLETWLYENVDLRIAVTLSGCTLRLFEKPLDPTNSNVFHLTTNEGNILAFYKQIDLERNKIFTISDTTLNDFYWKNLECDFHASCPSGLTILSVTGDGPDNPFYIRQSYISKGGPKDVSQEAYRKYLRNGTVLKFLHDNRVIVLRPNGVIVECISFEDTIITEEKNLEEGTADVRTGMQYGRIKVTGYNVLDHDGRRYEVLRDLIVREYDRLLFRENSDYEVDENFTRRSDGTDMLFHSNGKLIVHFPDGTRITTGYKIEERPLICDWTRDEFERYFGSIKLYEHDDRLFQVNSRNYYSNNYENGMDKVIVVDNSNNDKKFLWQKGEPLNDENRYQDEMTRILIADGFVSVLLTSTFEHKNYASVSYDQSAVSCTLSMPNDLRVSISRRGHYEVSAPGKVNLKIESDKLIFSSEMCATCAGRSTSVYNFNGRRSEPIVSTIFTSKDLFGNVFEVKSDGTTSYRGKNRERPSRKFDFNENAPDDDDVILSINRDLNAYEYLHRSIRHQEEMIVHLNKDASAIFPPVSIHRSNLHHLITFVPLETELRSKALLQSHQIPKVKPTNADRKDLVRSTYSIPYDWLFPFGRNGHGICNDRYDMPLAKTTKRRPPRTLRLRILHGFKEPGRNAIIDLQKAMASYWRYLVGNIDECQRSLNVYDGVQPKLEEDDYRTWKDNIREFALGIRTNIDVATYLDSLQRYRRELSMPKLEVKSKKLFEMLKLRKANEIQIEWHKRCIRENIILPYFENVIDFTSADDGNENHPCEPCFNEARILRRIDT
ncbi:PREDICTED: uncharacterized protein LOC107066065 [Polistes dominula]|uniref:Uncharacterized protein LOC107066065 n=1 Tax=Polistes dominula TaxID=743375 RepID=A0ABM1I6G9_POLDO|nr:PREDICTED: uncharacterized protein LOC107066065 [Polistes dominula]